MLYLWQKRTCGQDCWLRNKRSQEQQRNRNTKSSTNHHKSDLAPCDFFLFGKLKKKLNGKKFQSIEEIKVESKKAMKAIPKTDYQRCFADWKKRWLKCIAANGDYFEGDNLNLENIRYDSKHKEPNFEIGDVVLIKVYKQPNSGKLMQSFSGPYTIVDRISDNVVCIDRPNQYLGSSTDTVHVNKLRYYNEEVLHISPPKLENKKPNYQIGSFRHLTHGLIDNPEKPLVRRLAWPLRKDDTQNREAFSLSLHHRQAASPTGALCLGTSAYYLAVSGTWLTPPTSGTWHPPRRRRLLKLWEAVSEILELNHWVLPPHQLQELHIIGDSRFLRPPDLLVASRWAGMRVGDLTSSSSLSLPLPTRAALADIAALTTFCSRIVEENRNHTHRVDNIKDGIVLRGTATAFQA
ncbi:hypothetical protein LAZ67_9001706 [Cordylochernes scorpioides]|uniref:Uncharacterized protein n=1 Tax=Cordylochernes scorpioides TaxID=51811 RepID=A0ABY6KT65_9ARAC|nr:hypothetical protein LAZ67_9001706 [Cordylochernes scorpioides]